jgi:hypothetical protein
VWGRSLMMTRQPHIDLAFDIDHGTRESVKVELSSISRRPKQLALPFRPHYSTTADEIIE